MQNLPTTWPHAGSSVIHVHAFASLNIKALAVCVLVYSPATCFHIGSGVRVAVGSAEIRRFVCSCFLFSVTCSCERHHIDSLKHERVT